MCHENQIEWLWPGPASERLVFRGAAQNGQKRAFQTISRAHLRFGDRREREPLPLVVISSKTGRTSRDNRNAERYNGPAKGRSPNRLVVIAPGARR